MAETAKETIAGFEVAWAPPNPVNGVSGPPDILLQGSDEKLVTAHKAILSISTEMFNSILSMEVDASVPNTQIDGLPLLRFEESSKTLSLVVPLFYNLPDTRTGQASLELLHSAFSLSLKWAAMRATEVLEQRILHLLSTTRHDSGQADTIMQLYRLACISDKTWLEAQLLPFAARAIDITAPFEYVGALGSARCQKLYHRKLLYRERFYEIVREVIDECDVADQSIFRCGRQFDDCSEEGHSKLSMRYRKWLLNAARTLFAEERQPQWGSAHIEGEVDDNINDCGQTWFNDIGSIANDPYLEPCKFTVYQGMRSITDKWEEHLYVRTA